MHAWDGGPREPEQSDWDEDGACHGRGKAELGFGGTIVSSDETPVVTCPEGVGESAADHADEETKEGATDHLKVKVVDIREDEREGLEKEV